MFTQSRHFNFQYSLINKKIINKKKSFSFYYISRQIVFDGYSQDAVSRDQTLLCPPTGG